MAAPLNAIVEVEKIITVYHAQGHAYLDVN